MKKHLKLIIVIIVCIASAGVGLYFYLAPEELKVIIADEGSVSPQLIGTGKIEGDRKVTVYSDVAGVVDERLVQVGDRVSKGDILLGYAEDSQQHEVNRAATDVVYSEKILDAASGNRASWQQKYNAATAQIENCKVVYATLEVNIMSLDIDDHTKNYIINEQRKQYESDIIKKQTEISDKQADLAKIEADLRAIELKEEENPAKVNELTDQAKGLQDDIKELNDKISSDQRGSLCLPQESMDPETYKQYTIYQNNLETVTRMWSEARTDRDTAQSMLTSYQEIYSDENQVEQNKLTLSQAQTELDKARGGTCSPADGVITECLVDAGAYVEKGVPVFEMQSDNNYNVKMMVSKYDIAYVREGQEASVKIGNLSYSGKVSRISSTAENDSTGKARASVEIELDTEDVLIIGLDADVTLELESVEHVIRVPTECIYTDDDGSFVYIIDSGEVAKKYVSIGVKDSEYTQVEGIENGAHVVNDPGAKGCLGEQVKEIL